MKLFRRLARPVVTEQERQERQAARDQSIRAQEEALQQAHRVAPVIQLTREIREENHFIKIFRESGAVGGGA